MNIRLPILALCLTIYACDRPECQNRNPVFDQNAPESEVYKAELAKQLSKVRQENLYHWIAGYKETSSDTIMTVHVQNKELCAIMEMKLTDDEAVRQFKKVKGEGYIGARLVDLKYDMVQQDGKTVFIYRGMKRIFD